VLPYYIPLDSGLLDFKYRQNVKIRILVRGSGPVPGNYFHNRLFRLRRWLPSLPIVVCLKDTLWWHGVKSLFSIEPTFIPNLEHQRKTEINSSTVEIKSTELNILGLLGSMFRIE